jgi:hypothetical protein
MPNKKQRKQIKDLKNPEKEVYGNMQTTSCDS